MKKRRLVDITRGNVLDDERAGREMRRNIVAKKRMPGNRARARAFRPDRGKMTFARAMRADDHRRTMWPLRPAIHERERFRIRRAFEKIVAAKTLFVREIEGKLS